MYSVALNLPANEQVMRSVWENWELEESFDFQYSLFKMVWGGGSALILPPFTLMQITQTHDI